MWRSINDKIAKLLEYGIIMILSLMQLKGGIS